MTAFEAGEPPPRRPRVHDLERYAAEWTALVPDDPDERARVAHELAARHRLPRRRVTRIRAALGLDTDAVRAAYQARFGAPLDEVFTDRLTPGERVRWAAHAAATSLERLPPFWLTVVLTITVSLPVGLLGLPIAATEIGPLPALALLAFIGVVMSITMGALGETIARSGAVRYRRAFLGELAESLIGSRASAVFTGTAGVRTTLSLLAGWIGLSITMAELTDTPRGIWAGLILVGVLLMLTRGAKLALSTVALFGVFATVLVVVASVLALVNAGPGNLTHADFPLGGGPDALDGTLGAALGVILMQYIGSVYLVGIHRAAAPRDPSAKTLAAGAFVGTAIMTVIIGLWLLGASAAVSADELKATHGTAMGPLAKQIGPAMTVIGGLAMFLLLGMNINRASTAVHGLTLERLPQPREPDTPSGKRTLSRRWREVVACVPVLLVFGVAEATLDLGSASFASVLTISGVVTNFLVGAAIPMLMVVAARRHGELVPPRVWRWIGAAPLAWAIVGWSIASLAFVGVWVWNDWGSRSAALAMAALGLATVYWAVRQGAFRRRCVVEFIDDRHGAGGSRWAVVAAGRPVEADVELAFADGPPVTAHGASGPVDDPDGLRRLAFSGGERRGAEDVAFWGQRVDPDGTPEPTEATTEVDADGSGPWSVAVKLSPPAG